MAETGEDSGKGAPGPQEATETPQPKLGPAAQGRLDRAKQRSDQEELGQLMYEAYRAQTQTPATTPVSTEPPAAQEAPQTSQQQTPPPAPTRPSLSTKRMGELNPNRLKKSLKTPSAQWGRPEKDKTPA